MTTETRFRRVRTQFIAALGNPQASSGMGADQWGIWRVDPGPRGVRLSDYKRLEDNDGVAPRGGWQFDRDDWWLEEHGLIMEKPDFPLSPGKYMVTGDREVTTVLTVGEDHSWSLDEGTLHDVTHLPCRSARYHPAPGNTTASPASARRGDFPVTPGAAMPEVPGCTKNDYWVLFVIALPIE